MKTNLLYLLLALFLFSGCSKDDDDAAPEKTYLLQRKLSEVTFSSGGGVTIDLTYSYNPKNQLIRINGVIIREDELVPVHTDLSYDSEGRVRRVENRLGTVWTNEYNDKGQLVLSTRKYKTSEPYIYLHSYNDKNQLVEIKTYMKEVNQEAYRGNTLISYEGDNRIKIERTSVASGEIREYTIVTDNQKRELPPLPHQITAEFAAAEIFAEPYITNHNIASMDVVNKTPSNVLDISYQATRTYNQAGYPETCIMTFNHGSVEKITYVYTSK
ncbi:hypothetical protein [Pontibacter chinhatensis]|uniref:YD repeat-containing protein n=1 Tax=Pontibacter chinhatensis TaxID=1436961 RepID=A0A1I2XLI8_9BACT|nr:hypothetical protein [Pontibacter chinhatensis]SFH13889.1 YD repeat-containing protein [Pontibacter chinhatensis]